MSIYSTQPITFGGVRTYPLGFAKKQSQCAAILPAPWTESVPHEIPRCAARYSGGPGFARTACRHPSRPQKQKKAILWGLGGHVIKVGLGPLLIDLMRRGFVSGIAMNGAAMIHDFEVAMAWKTSEDVEAGFGEGQFGMAEETGKYINEMAKLAQRLRIGYGEAAGQYLTSGILSPKHPEVERSDGGLQVAESRYRASGNWHRYSRTFIRGRMAVALGAATQCRFSPVLRAGRSRWTPAACF